MINAVIMDDDKPQHSHIDSQPSTSKASNSTTSSSIKYYDLKTGLLIDWSVNTKLQVVEDEEATLKCDICKSSEKNHLSYGPFFKTSFAQCHYFCLLLCQEIQQSGRCDSTGILGFERTYILRGRQQIASNKCCYCDKKSANLGCAEEGCLKRFHLVCGFKNMCHFNFGEYVTYCDQHIKIEHDQAVVDAFDETDFCYACFEKIGKYHPVTCVLPSCCKLGWSHRDCLRKFADNAGYKFKCTLCADLNFREQASFDGIFIPDREPLWEFEGRYDDIDKMKCTAEKCHMRGKKDFLKCYVCGNKMGHAKCFDVTEENMNSYVCAKCMNNTYMEIAPSPPSW